MAAVSVLLVPIVLLKSTLFYHDKPNPLNNKAPVVGVRRNAVSRDILFSDVKAAAHRDNVTINDYVSAAMGVSVKRYFAEKNFNHTDHVTLVFPINIRYSIPTKPEEVVIGNYFSC